MLKNLRLQLERRRLKHQIRRLEIEVICLRMMITELKRLDFETVGPWLSASLGDPNVCDEMKAAVERWFDEGTHNIDLPERGR